MKAIVSGLLLVVLVLGLVLILVDRIDPAKQDLRSEQIGLARQQAAELAPFIVTTKKVLMVSGTTIVASVALIALAVAVNALGATPHVMRWAWVRSWLLYPRQQGAMYPTIAKPDGSGHITIEKPVNEHGAQRAAAVASGLQPGARLQGAAVRQLVNPTDPNYMLPPEEQARKLDAKEVLANYDPSKHPHWLFIGESGSGKSSAVYAVVDDMRRRLGAEFIILEKGGNNWNEQAAAITPAGYLDAFEAIEKERERREELIRAEDCQEADRLQQPPKFLVVVIEEAENVYSAVKSLGSSQAATYRDTLRDLAAMGRKQRILLVVATTTGTGQVFDVPVRRNLGNKFVFRSEPAAGDQYSIPREVNLPRLPTGTAYSLRDGVLVEFPHIGRPSLPASSLYRERRPEQLLLTNDADADGLGDEDQPSTQSERGTGSGTVVEEGVFPADTQAPSGTSRTTVPLEQRISRIPKDRAPRDRVDQETLYELWIAHGKNASAVERQVYSYDGGVAHYYAAYGINRALARRQQPPAYKEKE